MRYNPATDNAVENERIQAEMQFSFKPQPEPPKRVDWARLESLEFQGVKLGLHLSHGLVNCATLSHDILVSEAMGNWAEARRLRAQLITGLW